MGNEMGNEMGDELGDELDGDTMEPDRYHRLGLFPHADFGRLRSMKVIVVGVGGLGAVVCDILARCGIGTLEIFDYDTLEQANMNRLIYRPDQVGMPKVDAIAQYLQLANPDTKVIANSQDVTIDKGYSRLLYSINSDKSGEGCEGNEGNEGSSEDQKVDALFGCVDSFGVRLFLNAKCVKAGVPLFDGGTSLDGIRGSVHVVLPGETPCYRCNRPLTESHGMTGFKPKPDPNAPDHVTGLCHVTSLPTTMSIIASLQCQEAFKHLLGFGSVAPYLIYDGADGTLQRVDWVLDPGCPICGDGRAQKNEKRTDDSDGKAQEDEEGADDSDGRAQEAEERAEDNDVGTQDDEEGADDKDDRTDVNDETGKSRIPRPSPDVLDRAARIFDEISSKENGRD